MHHRILIAASLLTPGVALAEITASTYLGGGVEQGFVGATGWYFTPSTDVVVTRLGLLDLGDPGFIDAHQIGVFRAADDAALVTTSIASGLTGELIDGSRFVDIPELALTGGERYYIVADNWFNDTYAFGDASVEFAPEIAWNGYASSPVNDIFNGIENIGGQEGNLGPNFRFRLVPAPASAGVLAGAGLAWSRRRR
ncbi:MAG: hypothetical protein RIB60_10925 [Phycisphaerales bacterium]